MNSTVLRPGHNQFEFRDPNAIGWYVAETSPRKEMFAVENLKRRDFFAFCPRFPKARANARRQETTLVPLFPGYIFVRFDATYQHWRSISSAKGVKRLLGMQGPRPTPMPFIAMSEIFSRCDDGVVRRLIDQPHCGQQVRFASGPLGGSLAVIESLDAKGRVRVLLQLLGEERGLDTRLELLEPA